jgi:hypothetical protein
MQRHDDAPPRTDSSERGEELPLPPTATPLP